MNIKNNENALESLPKSICHDLAEMNNRMSENVKYIRASWKLHQKSYGNLDLFLSIWFLYLMPYKLSWVIKYQSQISKKRI